MTRLLRTTGLLLALALVSCGGANPAADLAAPRLTPIHGTSLENVSYEVESTQLTVNLSSLPPQGKFFELALPDHVASGAETWEGDGKVVHLLVPTPTGLQLGVVPLAAYAGELVTLQLQLAGEPRCVRTPPQGPENLVTDLSVTETGYRGVALRWTQVNAGDYDLNGQVNITDLTPLGQHFGKTYDPDGPDVRQEPLYWIDGDGNGEINVADITAIGRHFGVAVEGYSVKRGGVEQLVVPRSEASTRDGLPPIYLVELDGWPEDTWFVAPVDAEGAEGSGSTEPTVDKMDLRVSIEIGGLDLLELENGGWELLRVIDPIDIVDRGEVVYGPEGIVLVDGLPRQVQLQLDIAYAPIYELATGSDNVDAGQVITSLPFELPSWDTQAQLDLTIDLAPRADFGYFVTLTATSEPAGVVEPTVVRLDYPASRVSMDTSGDGEFGDEARLQDNDRNCVSASRRQQMVDDDRYAGNPRDEIEITNGFIEEFDEKNGRISLAAFPTVPMEQVIGSGEEPYPLFDQARVISFSELTLFVAGVDELHLPPSELTVGDEVVIRGYLLHGDGGQTLADMKWATKVRKVN